MSGSFLLSHSSSLPPASLSRCFLCQPGSTPASPLLGQTPVIISHVRLMWAVAFQSVPIIPSAQRRGLQGMALRLGTHCHLLLPPFKTHISWEKRLQGHSRATSCSAWVFGLIPFPIWASVSWGSPQPTQPLGTEAHGMPCVHLVVVLFCFAKDFYFWRGSIGELLPTTWQWLEM